MNGNYERLLSREIFTGDEPPVEEIELLARLDKEAYYADLRVDIEAIRSEEQA